jgi:hypothetical protein
MNLNKTAGPGQGPFLARTERTFSMLYSESALDAMSTASCCIFSSMSAFLITAFRCSPLMLACCCIRIDSRERETLLRSRQSGAGTGE